MPTLLRRDAINAFLNDRMQPPDPYQDVAVALDAVAHAAMEAQFEIERRAAS